MDSGTTLFVIVIVVLFILLGLVLAFPRQIGRNILGPLFKTGVDSISKYDTTSNQVDAWSAFVPDRGNLKSQLQQGVINAMKRRKIPNLDLSIGELGISNSALEQIFKAYETREYIFFSQTLGMTGKSTCALRIAQRGAQDLELSWRLLESNPTKKLLLGLSQGAIIFLGIAFIGAGLLTIMFGFGFCAIPIGVWLVGSGMGWWGKTNRESQLSSEQRKDSRILAQTVDYCLMKELDKLGVSADELRITQEAQTSGIGKL
jgi:hypothetical protein